MIVIFRVCNITKNNVLSIRKCDKAIFLVIVQANHFEHSLKTGAGNRFLCSCSKGLVVNFYEVDKQEDGMFILKNGSFVPISRRKAKEILEAFARFRFEQMRKGGN